MRKVKSTILIIFLLVGGAAGLFLYTVRGETDGFIQDARNKKELLNIATEIWEFWRKGRDSKLYQEADSVCLKEKSQLLSCSHDALKCLLKDQPFRVMRKGTSKVRVIKVERVSKANNLMLPSEGSKLILEFKKSQLILVLEKNCQKIYLPQRIYGYGEEANPDMTKRFDNFGKNIFIDKETTPSIGMNIEEIRGSCHKRGMQLLESHILDAAAFHPVDLKNNRPQEFLRPKLPWTRRFKSEFIAKAQKDKSFKFEEKFCDYIYTKECIKLKNTSLPSWMGLRNPLGGHVEIIRNIISPNKRIVPSSFYFSIHSDWNRLGLRSSWDGETFDMSSMQLKMEGVDNFSKVRTGFRCMQEVWDL